MLPTHHSPVNLPSHSHSTIFQMIYWCFLFFVFFFVCYPSKSHGCLCQTISLRKQMKYTYHLLFIMDSRQIENVQFVAVGYLIVSVWIVASAYFNVFVFIIILFFYVCIDAVYELNPPPPQGAVFNLSLYCTLLYNKMSSFSIYAVFMQPVWNESHDYRDSPRVTEKNGFCPKKTKQLKYMRKKSLFHPINMQTFRSKNGRIVMSCRRINWDIVL